MSPSQICTSSEWFDEVQLNDIILQTMSLTGSGSSAGIPEGWNLLADIIVDDTRTIAVWKRCAVNEAKPTWYNFVGDSNLTSYLTRGCVESGSPIIDGSIDKIGADFTEYIKNNYQMDTLYAAQLYNLLFSQLKEA